MLSVFRRSELEHHMCSVSGSCLWLRGVVVREEGEGGEHHLTCVENKKVENLELCPSHPLTPSYSGSQQMRHSCEQLRGETLGVNMF